MTEKMKFNQYRELFRVPAVRRLLLVGVLARVPHAAIGLILTLHVVNTLGESYAAAGIVAMAVTIGIALGAPWRGRLIDQNGLRRTLMVSIIAEAIIWPVAAFLPYYLLVFAVFIGGALMVPIFTVVRQSLGVMTSVAQRRTAYALDSIGAELTFMIGPAVGAAMATVNTQVALVVVGLAASLAGVFLYWFNPPTRSGQPGSYQGQESEDESLEIPTPAREQGSIGYAGVTFLGRIRSVLPEKVQARIDWINLPILAALAASLGAGLSLAGTDVGIVATLRQQGQEAQIGIVFVVWCAASAFGGVMYGAMQRRVNPLWLLTGLALFTIPLGFATDTWSLALLSILPGLLTAPVLSSSAEWIADLVPEERRGEAMGWYGSALTAGSALGAPLAGAAIDMFGPGGGFAMVGGVAAFLGLAGLVFRQVRRRRAN